MDDSLPRLQAAAIAFRDARDWAQLRAVPVRVRMFGWADAGGAGQPSARPAARQDQGGQFAKLSMARTTRSDRLGLGPLQESLPLLPGWLLHPHSLVSMSQGTLWLARPGVPLLLEITSGETAVTSDLTVEVPVSGAVNKR